MASSADIPSYMRTSFLMSNYQEMNWPQCILKYKQMMPSFLSTLAVHIKTHKTREGKLPKLTVNSLSDLKSCGKSTGDIYTENQAEANNGKILSHYSERLPSTPYGQPSSGLRANASHSDSQPSIPRSPKLFLSSPRSAIKQPKKTNLSDHPSH